jgi:hypothetical protein
MLKCLLGEYGPSATLNGSSLVLSLPDANRPVVWTLDLHKDGHGALTLDQDSETGEYILVFQGTKKGAEILEVARYNAKSKAVKAMMAASDSLKSAHSNTSTQDTKKSYSNSFTQWFVTIVGIIVLVSFYFLVTGGPQGFGRTPLGQAINERLAPAPQYTPTQNTQNTENQDNNPPADAIGVPMDADNFFEELMNK